MNSQPRISFTQDFLNRIEVEDLWNLADDILRGKDGAVVHNVSDEDIFLEAADRIEDSTKFRPNTIRLGYVDHSAKVNLYGAEDNTYILFPLGSGDITLQDGNPRYFEYGDMIILDRHTQRREVMLKTPYAPIYYFCFYRIKRDSQRRVEYDPSINLDIEAGYYGVLDYMIRNGVPADTIAENSPLEKRQDPIFVEYMLSNKAKLDFLGPAIEAAYENMQNGDTSVLEYLLDKTWFNTDIGSRVLVTAAQRGDLPMVKYFREAELFQYQREAIEEAERAGHMEVARYIREDMI